MTLIVLDDDPTGTQAVHGIPVMLEWDQASLESVGARAPAAVHILVNTRAYTPEKAYEIVRDAGERALAAFPEGSRLINRGDSTLRAHVFEEYRAASEVAFPGRDPVLLLVPALPPAGRVTVGGVHYVESDGDRTPLHDTEYAGDGGFRYTDARLLQWAEDRSGGHFQRADGAEISLETIRGEGGAKAVADTLEELSERGRPAACVPDVETNEDMAVIAEGLSLAWEHGAAVMPRSAPTFVGVVAGTLATELAPPPEKPERLLVVCGSYVPATTRQLARLLEDHPGALVEVDVEALASDGPEDEMTRAGGEVRDRLDRDGLAVMATPRERPTATINLAAGERIADNLALILHELDRRPDVVLSKGGITSAVTARVGLGATEALVVGPIADGVALWHARADDGATVPYIVFPGNVGGDDAVRAVVAQILRA